MTLPAAIPPQSAGRIPLQSASRIPPKKNINFSVSLRLGRAGNPIFGEKRTMKIKDLLNDERPREKMLAKGAGSLSNTELIALLLRSGTHGKNVLEVAMSLLHDVGGSLTSLSSMSVEKLCSYEGIGMGKALTLLAAVELGRRSCSEGSVFDKVSLNTPGLIYEMMLPRLKGLDHEECWVIYLNRANYLIASEKISSGGHDSTVIDIRYILRKALERQASAVILVHNHPSGSPRPGTADMRETAALKKALDTIGIALLDHVIVADDCFYSFSDERVMSKGKPG